MNRQQEMLFRQWLSKNGYTPLPWSAHGIAFRKNGSETIEWIFPLARGGVNGTREGYGAYTEWKRTGVGPQSYTVLVPNVSSDVAVELFIHHFQLALAYCQVTPEDGGAQIVEEAERIMAADPDGLSLLKILVDAISKQFDAFREKLDESI